MLAIHAVALGGQWAGVQLSAAASSLLIDPLQDAGAVWAAAGDLAREVPMPGVVPAEPAGAAAVGLVTHVHCDHADAAALTAALPPGGAVLVPEPFGGSPLDEAAVLQAGQELEAAGLALTAVRPWESLDVDGWTITAIPAVDGTGDSQASWLVERDGVAVVHAGDTLIHHWW